MTDCIISPLEKARRFNNVLIVLKICATLGAVLSVLLVAEHYSPFMNMPILASIMAIITIFALNYGREQWQRQTSVIRQKKLGERYQSKTEKALAERGFMVMTFLFSVAATLVCIINGYNPFELNRATAVRLPGMIYFYDTYGSNMYLILFMVLGLFKGVILSVYNTEKNAFKHYREGDTFLHQSELLSNNLPAVISGILAMVLGFDQIFTGGNPLIWLLVSTVMLGFGIYNCVTAYMRIGSHITHDAGEKVAKFHLLRPLGFVIFGKLAFLFLDAYLLYSSGFIALMLVQTAAQLAKNVYNEHRDYKVEHPEQFLPWLWARWEPVIMWHRHSELFFMVWVWLIGEVTLHISRLFVSVGFSNTIQSLTKGFSVYTNEYSVGKEKNSKEIKFIIIMIGISITGMLIQLNF